MPRYTDRSRITVEAQYDLASYWLECLNNSPTKKLTSWELDFIISIAEKMEDGNCILSDRQWEILEDLYANKT